MEIGPPVTSKTNIIHEYDKVDHGAIGYGHARSGEAFANTTLDASTNNPSPFEEFLMYVEGAGHQQNSSTAEEPHAKISTGRLREIAGSASFEGASFYYDPHPTWLSFS
jgi:hypothetical protein